MTVSWFVPQNQVCFDLSVALQNRRREVGAGHASRSSGLLGVEVCLDRVSQSDLGVKASLARIFQSGLKTVGDVTPGGARGTITEVASEAR
jgi:hypothetical protein